MAAITDEQLKKVLINPVLSGSGNHYISDCPFCHKKEHFYVQRQTGKTNSRGENVTFFFHCKKCNESGKVYKLLKQLGRADLVQFKESISTKLQAIQTIAENVEIEVEEMSIPANFSRVYFHKYLQGRGFVDSQYDQYIVGTIDSPIYNDYVIFPITENGVWKGFVARCVLPNLDELNRGRAFKILRYKNSANTDFSKLLFGLDEFTPLTKTVILVEGVFDKFNIDKQLELHANEKFKCVACFGKKISEAQIEKLRKAGVEKVYLFFDDDAKKDSAAYGFKLQTVFSAFKTRIVECIGGKKDAGEMSQAELIKCLQQSYTPFSFHNKIVNYLK